MAFVLLLYIVFFFLVRVWVHYGVAFLLSTGLFYIVRGFLCSSLLSFRQWALGPGV